MAGSSIAGALASAAAGACYGLSFAWSKRHLMGIPPLVAATAMGCATSMERSRDTATFAARYLDELMVVATSQAPVMLERLLPVLGRPTGQQAIRSPLTLH